MKTDIRIANTEDLTAVMTLYGELFPREKHCADPAKLSASWLSILSDARLNCFVLEVDSRVCATATLDIVPNIARNCRPYSTVENVVVAAEHRGRGLGRLLLQHVIDFAFSKGCYKVELMSGREEAFGFYRSLGFESTKFAFGIRADDV